tara:strand:+ start:1340 stop:1564 length:225 start_codon:yes stop_codon:yes gene_type:complete
MNIGDIVWFCWWKGPYPNKSGMPDLIRKAALILGEYESLDDTEELWYEIYIFEENRRILVDKVKLEKVVKQEDN